MRSRPRHRPPRKHHKDFSVIQTPKAMSVWETTHLLTTCLQGRGGAQLGPKLWEGNLEARLPSGRLSDTVPGPLGWVL